MRSVIHVLVTCTCGFCFWMRSVDLVCVMLCMLESVRSYNFVQEIDGFGCAFGNLVS